MTSLERSASTNLSVGFYCEREGKWGVLCELSGSQLGLCLNPHEIRGCRSNEKTPNGCNKEGCQVKETSE